MPVIKAYGLAISCPPQANLRTVLIKNDIPVHNGTASVINCHGLGTCGTCAVQIEGEVSEVGSRERLRLSLPPHSVDRGRRLACQTRVLGDIEVTKYTGFWGQNSDVGWTP